MVDFENKINKLQYEIDKVAYGYCLMFHLLNHNELNAIEAQNDHLIHILDRIICEVSRELIIDDQSSNYFANIKDKKIKSYFEFVNNLNKVVSDNPLLYTNKLIYRQIDLDKILLIIPTKNYGLIKKFASKVYMLAQLYVDKTPTIYLNCSIASVEFPKVSNDAKKIYHILNWLSSYPGEQLYYRAYDNKKFNIENIRESNKQLQMLRKSLLNQNVVFAYQPVINCRSKEILYYESLLRIPDGNDGFVSVGEIIPKAEKTGLIFVIDKIVLNMVIKKLVLHPDLVLSVNISNIGISDPYLLTFAEELLITHNVLNRLIIEITESTLNQNYAIITFFIQRLKQYGCRFALDDFGVGFTSFKQLQSLPIDIIKIDGSYVSKVITDKQCQEFISRVIEFSKNLGAITIAECVENSEIADFLIKLGIDGMQGNYFSPASVEFFRHSDN